MTASNWGENSWGTGEWGEGGNIDVTVGGAGWGENAWNSGLGVYLITIYLFLLI
jgi:hypothetical protein